ncbi:hypothetical protein WA026_004503 [Henosepilachna vigintioctopunctata]|uniref:Uncharacterized protein n=1 Tax=Henosepilachna vigintioctopunctata TaxID=420089 RepID=A0AAW1V3I7_9CUCU
MVSVKILLGFLFLFFRGSSVKASCYFQQEFQGEYVMQSSVTGSRIQYQTLIINATSIPIWGTCHKRIGNNYILRMSYGETSCIRCFHLKLKSSNVLQVITSYNTFSKCHINEEQTEGRCPSEESLNSNDTTKMLLFKTKDWHEAPTPRKYCPLDGKYSVTYITRNLRSMKKIECAGLDSTMDSCPSGSTLNLRLKGCNLESNEFKFECLGSWTDMKGENFIIFTDNRQQRPEYRCAVYEKERGTGRIFMALSNDSTCSSDLHNATSGSETFILTPKQSIPWPADVTLGTCSFPEWMRGDWEHIRVSSDTLIYQDHSSLKTYTMKCVGFQEVGSKYLVYSRTQCDEERYSCLWIHKRTNNILEFQMGLKSSKENNVFELCHDANFIEDSWITQGRISASATPKMYPGMCPISGEYTGVITDATDLCAKLQSDCKAEIMYYQVSNCTSGEVYEEREYECLGHWREADLLYTYTKRMDVAADSYECFVGSITPNEEIFIKEAGSFCQRNMDPVKNGMQLYKNVLYPCVNKLKIPEKASNDTYETEIERTSVSPTISTSTITVGYTKSTRKPWNFDNNIDDTDPNPKSPNSADLVYSILPLCVYMISIVLIL